MTIDSRCHDCGMPCSYGDYHPYAACLMFKDSHSSEIVRENLQAILEEGRATSTQTNRNKTANWQLIDTAPKDGTVIDLVVNGQRVPSAYWSFSTNADGSPDPTAFDCWAQKGRYAGVGGAYPVGIGGNPTHWMPVPDLP